MTADNSELKITNFQEFTTNDFSNDSKKREFRTERPNYFPGQYLLEDDFQLQHEYLSDRQKYFNSRLHVSGIIEGLEVSPTEDVNAVTISSGSAINNLGQLIVLKSDTPLADFQSLQHGHVYITYSERLEEPQGGENTETRMVELIKIGFGEQTPEGSVTLAKINKTSPPITAADIDLTKRQYSGINLPNAKGLDITLRTGGSKGSLSAAILTGSLQIESNLEVKGETTLKSLSIPIDLLGQDEQNRNYRASLQITNKMGQDDTEDKGIVLLLPPKRETQVDHPIFTIRAREHSGSSFYTEWYGYTGSDTNSAYFAGTKNNYFKSKVGIGTTKPGEYKLKVEGDSYIHGKLEVSAGYKDGDQIKKERAIILEPPNPNKNVSYRDNGEPKEATGMVYRIKENPPEGSPILQVRNASEEVGFFVENNGWTGSAKNSAWFAGERINYFKEKVSIGTKDRLDKTILKGYGKAEIESMEINTDLEVKGNFHLNGEKIDMLGYKKVKIHEPNEVFESKPKGLVANGLFVLEYSCGIAKMCGYLMYSFNSTMYPDDEKEDPTAYEGYLRAELRPYCAQAIHIVYPVIMQNSLTTLPFEYECNWVIINREGKLTAAKSAYVDKYGTVHVYFDQIVYALASYME